MPRFRIILWVLLLLPCAAGVVVCWMDSFGYCEVCGICGKGCRVVEYRVPFSKNVFWRSFEERATLLSEWCGRHPGLVDMPHEHQWLFVSGNDWATCFLGNGQEVLATAETEFVIEHLEQLRKNDPDGLKQALADALDPAKTREFLLKTCFPKFRRDEGGP